jgi:hypothetical protein
MLWVSRWSGGVETGWGKIITSDMPGGNPVPGSALSGAASWWLESKGILKCASDIGLRLDIFEDPSKIRNLSLTRSFTTRRPLTKSGPRILTHNCVEGEMTREDGPGPL